MPALVGITPDSALRSVVDAALLEQYRGKVQISSNLGRCMAIGQTAEARIETMVVEDSAPQLARWDRGDSISGALSQVVTWEIVATDFGVKLKYHRDDLADAQKLFARGTKWAADLIQRCRQLPEDVLFQILDSVSDPRLLAALPTAPDGMPIFSAVDGDGAARFGAGALGGPAGSGGNIQVGQGFGSVAAIQSDLMRADARVMEFKDTRGAQLHPDNVAEEKIVIASSQHLELFKRAFKQQNIAVAGGNESNVILDAGDGVTLWLTTRKAATSTVVLYPRAGGSGLVERVLGAPRTTQADESNSDVARETKEHAIYAEYRAGYGLAYPLGAVLINNS